MKEHVWNNILPESYKLASNIPGPTTSNTGNDQE